MTEKICKECKRKKPVDQFYKEPTGKDGYKNICKSCMDNIEQIEKKVLSKDVAALMKYHKYRPVEYFGYRVGYIITIRKKEYLAYSLLKGSQVFNNTGACRAWLCERIMKAGNIIKHGLMKRLKDFR